MNGDSGSATLNFQINDTNFGISVSDLGELYGTAIPIVATKKLEWPHFYYAEKEIDPERTAASQLWYGKLNYMCSYSIHRVSC